MSVEKKGIGGEELEVGRKKKTKILLKFWWPALIDLMVSWNHYRL